MGLLLSVLVVCAGVIELLSIYSDVRRHLRPPQAHTSLQQVKGNYVKDLHSLKKRLLKEVEASQEEVEVEGTKELTCESRFNLIPSVLVAQDSHEEIDIEINKNVLAVGPRSRSPSPRRYLVTEKEGNRDRSPRRFLVSEEPQGLVGLDDSSVPEFIFKEKQSYDQESKRYVLKQSQSPRSRSPIPLPKQFVVTEDTNPEIKQKMPSPLRRSPAFRFDSYGEEASSSLSCEINQAEVEKRYLESAEAFRRSPSPYPSFDLSAPRNSVCSELLDNPNITVNEVDEELYISKSSSYADLESSTFDSTLYWNRKSLGVPQKSRSKSRTPERDARDAKSNSVSPRASRKLRKSPNFDEACDAALLRSFSKSDSRINDIHLNAPFASKTFSNNEMVVGEFMGFSVEIPLESNKVDEKYLNDLDGIKEGSSSKKKSKRKRSLPKKSGNRSVESANSKDGEDRNDLVKEKSNVAGTSKQKDQPSNKKEPEAFWVNH